MEECKGSINYNSSSVTRRGCDEDEGEISCVIPTGAMFTTALNQRITELIASKELVSIDTFEENIELKRRSDMW